jgi:YtkA-like
MYRHIFSVLSLVALVVTAGCAAPPPGLDLSLTHPTIDKKFLVALRPPATPAAINQMHSWQIKVTSPSGAPVTHARIAVDGGMPQHGHGLPTRPQVTQELADGTYLLEGMKFSMTGWWEIKLAIQSAEGTDKVTFNTVVATPTATR